MRVLALLSLILLLFACQQKTVRDDAYHQELSRYVYAYSAGSIGRNDVVKVRFVDPAVGADQVGKDADATLLALSPAITGRLYWEDERTLTLQPKEPLPYGKKYNAELALRKLFPGAPKSLSTFPFEFRVRELSYDVQIDGLSAIDGDARRQKITGRVRTSDPADKAAIEKMLGAEQGNQNLGISWSHTDDGLTHAFEATDIKRGDVRSNVRLHWNGSALGLSDKGAEEDIMVPAIDEFIVLGARVEQSESPCVVINFSDPVSTDQSLDGLIYLQDNNNGYRHAVDGNFVRLFPTQSPTGNQTLVVEAGVRNSAGAAMKERFTRRVNFESLQPAVRLVGRGAIIPKNDQGKVVFPFEAVGLNMVDVEVFKIYQSNILHFLQVNEIEGEQELERVGKIVLQKSVSLSDLNPGANRNAWQRYALDLSELVDKDPAAIYQVRLAFRRNYTNLPCAAEEATTYSSGQNDDGQWRTIMGGYYGIYFDTEGDGWWSRDNDFEWSRRDEPCAREYYNREHFEQRNVFVSDLGLTAKAGRDGSIFVAVTDLISAQPVGGVQVKVYNYQLQPIATVNTAADGTAYLRDLREKPFLTVAEQGGRRGYVRMADGSTLSLSRFDVAGVDMPKGLKGYLYGERGVWRPGDSIYLNFVLEDKIGDLPPNHPISFELTDPQGSLRHRYTGSTNVNGVYPLHCATSPEAPTGNWIAKVKVGSVEFSKTLKIETVKPNRLRMDLDFGKKQLLASEKQLNGNLQVNWLHGAPGKNLNTTVELQMQATKTTFDGYKSFVFDDPARPFYSDPQTIFEGTTNELGQAKVPFELTDNGEAPGKLIARFKIRSFEKGGDFSTDNYSLDYYPYDRFVGVEIPNDSRGNPSIGEKGGTVNFVCVDQNGRPLANQKLEVGLYRCDWRWWWDEDSRYNVAQFNSATHVNALEKTTLTTNEKGIATWKVSPDEWGRYLIRVSDLEGGHAAGSFFWRGYPDRLDDMHSRNAAAMIAFKTDKENYSVGETVTLTVPASENGRMLITLENGSKVLQHRWVEAKAGDNTVTFVTTADMTPSVYAHLSLFQPHAQTKNDLPIRMYGVAPIGVENPATHLKPTIDMPEVLKPGEDFTVNIRESSGKACAYTLAVVDEGLLDLTRFETPDPWKSFFAREALGVKTWDMYDYVLGAYGTELERMLSIGGDEYNQKAKNGAQVNRFKPAVRHVGPFYLKAGETARHTLNIDNYVGSVRTMVVCSAPAAQSKGAYGSAEKTCPIRKPLMIMPTLPRVLGPGETFRLPVEVFAMENKVKAATVRVKETSGLVTMKGNASSTLSFPQPGQEIASFDMTVGQRPGVAKFEIEAQGGGETARQTIELLVRNPNPVQTSVQYNTIEPGAEWKAGYDASKYAEFTTATMEVSALPPINLNRHLEYLLQYPHGCVEQTTSTGFPQLYVDAVMNLTPKQQETARRNIEATIGKLRSFQQGNGSFSYWPGDNDVNEWSSIYAGHFLLEAKSKGFSIPEGMLDRWTTYLEQTSRRWNAMTDNDFVGHYEHNLTQAYRLYALALAGKPDLSGMNRLKEQKNQYQQSALMLAAAYATAGKPEVAKQLASTKWQDDFRYDWCGYTYGSDLRDRALLLETYTIMGDNARAQAMVQYLSDEMNKQEGSWQWNTQSLATTLRAFSKYATKNFGGSGAAYTYRVGNAGEKTGDGSKPVSAVNFTEQAFNAGQVSVKNKGNAKLYARMVLSGQPVAGAEVPQSENLTISIRYTDTKGNAIDPARLQQGADFVAEVSIARKSAFGFPFTELALTQVFPSGWEIMNARMGDFQQGPASPVDYQDVRDDRVYTYFDLPTQKDKRVYRIYLNAAYAGRYYLPAVNCQAMYDSRIRAGAPGKWVEVI
jgi:uncharacterized protein YfaS (alpha-2-macroglobulin family)